MNEHYEEISELLKSLLEEVPSKARVEIELAVTMLRDDLDQEGLIKFADQLELISNLPNVNSFVRSEVLNILSEIESLL